MHKIRIGIFGVSHLGKVHLKLLREIDAFEVVGFYDTNEINAQEVEADTGVKAFSSPELLLESVDAIDIVSTTSAHYDLAFALSARKNILSLKSLLFLPWSMLS